MSWYVYEISPIDANWEHLSTVDSVAKKLASDEAASEVRHGVPVNPTPSYRDFMSSWSSAQDAARDKGWDGVFRVAPVVTWYPVEESFDVGFVLKQDNNGTTYVVSPVRLTHLE